MGQLGCLIHFHRKRIGQVHCIYRPARFATMCFSPPSRGSFNIIYTGSIDIDTHAGRQGRDMDLTRCCLQPWLDAADNCLIDVFNSFLLEYRLFVMHPGRSLHFTDAAIRNLPTYNKRHSLYPSSWTGDFSQGWKITWRYLLLVLDYCLIPRDMVMDTLWTCPYCGDIVMDMSITSGHYD